MKKFFIVATLVCSVIAAPAMARDFSDEVQRAYGDPLRHLRPNADDIGLDNSQNVEIAWLTFDVLPPFMQYQAKVIADCVKNQEAPNMLKYFSYVSDFNRRKGFAPHYLIDTSDLKDMRAELCIFGDICSEGQCALLGFSVDAEGWHNTVNMPVYNWSIETVQIDDKNTQLFFNTLFRPTGACEPPTGMHTEEGCVSRYTWGLRSFIVQSLPASE